MARYPVEWAAFERDPRATLPASVESLAMVAGRMLVGLRAAAATTATPALIVSHGRAIRTLAELASREPTAPLANAGAYRVEVENGEPVRAALLDGPTGRAR